MCVEQSEVAVIEEWGKFKTLARPGVTMLTPCKDSVAGKVSLRIQDMNCLIESKTKDNVFTNLKVSIQYRIIPELVEKAFYSLSDPYHQIEDYVFNGIRGKLPKYNIDEVFLMRSEIAKELKQEIDEQMEHYGYDVVATLITDIDPAQSVKDAMNQIQTASRMKAAAGDKAEASKLEVIKNAEADAEAKRLSGVGLAEQRKAVVAGLQSSIETFKGGVQDLSSHEVMSLLLMNQYFDTLKEVAAYSKGSTIFLPHTGGLNAVAEQMNAGVLKKRQ